MSEQHYVLTTQNPQVVVCDTYVMPLTEVQWCPKQRVSSVVSAKLCTVVGDNKVVTILFLLTEKFDWQLQLITFTDTTVDLLLFNTIMIQSK